MMRRHQNPEMAVALRYFRPGQKVALHPAGNITRQQEFNPLITRDQNTG